MRRTFHRFVKDDAGQDMIEYSLLAAFISIVAWTVVQAIGTDVNQMYTNIDSATSAAASAS